MFTVRTPVLLTAVLAVVVATACSPDDPSATTEAPGATTAVPEIPERVVTTTTQDPGAADDSVADRVGDAVAALIEEVEVVRGLPFVVPPGVLVLTADAYDARWAAQAEARLQSTPAVGKTSLYRAAGLLSSFESIETMLGRLPASPTPVFYEPDEFRLVISEAADELDPSVRAAMFHELVLALVDQHYDTASTRADLVARGADDELAAFDALIEGDATYFQLVFVQRMSTEDQAVVAEAFAATDSAVIDALPSFLREDLAFAYDAGTTFIGDLVFTGGVAAVDQAYRNPPVSSSHIIHPERYRGGDAPTVVAPLNVAPDGAAATPSTTFGELQLDHLLSASLDPGLVTQAIDGWQGDQYQLVDGPEGMAFVLTLSMASKEDAIEVVGGLVTHAREVLLAGDGIEDGGGLLWDDGSYYVFIDRVGDGLVYVLATDPTLGSAARRAASAP